MQDTLTRDDMTRPNKRCVTSITITMGAFGVNKTLPVVLYDDSMHIAHSYKFDGIKTLNPLIDVVATQLGICGCQCTSFVISLPECTNSNCGGISPSTPPRKSSGPSSSMLKS
mmetsp:Transcript_6965/g.17228  ORF Transcript_6965/g.17228 Transcript_6965/m.17228 type:complete len:113 (+) Transcript_6965:189-527(+)